MTKQKTSIIIPVYLVGLHLLGMTERCLDSLKASKYKGEVIIVDDGSPMALKTKYKVVERKTNGGYAAAVNTGLQEATGDILIISNNDIEFVQHDWLDHLLKPFEWGFDISCIRTSDSDGWLTDNRLEENAKFGSIWAMKREVYEKLGGLDETFGKGYFEDLDYRRRAINAGFKIAKNHAGVVEHFGKSTFREVDPADDHYRNGLIHYQKKWGFIE